MRFQVTCTGNRVAEITAETGDIDGDTDHDATDGQAKPTNWVDNILSMKFYKDSSYTTEMSGSAVVVPFGDNVYTKIVIDDTDEALLTRVTDCWATESNGKYIQLCV